jgi:hypothetical protein
MARFLVEVDHDAGTVACARAVRVFLTTGSHFLAQAVWGCMDGVHSAWIIVDVTDKEEARALVPPAFRARTRVVLLSEFSADQIEGLLAAHHP